MATCVYCYYTRGNNNIYGTSTVTVQLYKNISSLVTGRKSKSLLSCSIKAAMKVAQCIILLKFEYANTLLPGNMTGWESYGGGLKIRLRRKQPV